MNLRFVSSSPAAVLPGTDASEVTIVVRHSSASAARQPTCGQKNGEKRTLLRIRR